MDVQVWSWAVWLVLGLAGCGFLAVCWVVAGWAERAADWWRRDRITPLLEECDHEYTPNEAGTYEWCQQCDSVRPTLLELAPERTWEQMTSHQLPLEPPHNPKARQHGGYQHVGIPPECPACPPLEAGAADHFLRPPGYLDAHQERRAPWWEAEQRQAYAALGLEYPSGLLARVREAAQ